MLSYARTLERLGIGLRIRQVDTPQYWSRLKTFDFDMIQWTWSASLSPGNEQINRWSSKAADIEGSLNYPGVKNPAADAMIEALLQARDGGGLHGRGARLRPRADVGRLRDPLVPPAEGVGGPLEPPALPRDPAARRASISTPGGRRAPRVTASGMHSRKRISAHAPRPTPCEIPAPDAIAPPAAAQYQARHGARQAESRSAKTWPTSQRLLARMRAGERRAISRAVTELERLSAAAPRLLQAMEPHLGHALVARLHGTAGGRASRRWSTPTRSTCAREGKTVGIIAVDPSSPVSGGAILGDRIRMTATLDDDGVFMRSLASRGHLGGLCPAAVRVIDALDAAGKDLILIETVGTGQSEIDVAEVADVRVLVTAPGLGDDIQAMKAGPHRDRRHHGGQQGRPRGGRPHRCSSSRARCRCARTIASRCRCSRPRRPRAPASRRWPRPSPRSAPAAWPRARTSAAAAAPAT